MKAIRTIFGVMSCCLLSAVAADTGKVATVKISAGTAVISEKIWDQYSQVFTKDFGGAGPERGNEQAKAFAIVMSSHDPVAGIRVSPEQTPRRSTSGRTTGIRVPKHGSAAMGVFLGQVLRYAFDLNPQFPKNRIIIPSEFASTRYDYVDTMRQGGREALRQALRTQFGLEARWEKRQDAEGQEQQFLVAEKVK